MKRTSRKPKRTSRSPKRGSRGLRANWPKRQPADPEGARELLLVTQNESSLYRQHEAIAENLLKKLKKGRYDHSKAWKGWLYWIDSGAQYYSKHYGGSFNPATREMAAREYADDWLAEMRAQGMTANGGLRCAGMAGPCGEAATWIDNKGWAYCAKHGQQRRATGTPARQLTASEIRSLESGQPISYSRKRVSRNARNMRFSRSRDPRWLTARFDSLDSDGNRVRKGDEVLYWPLTRTVMSGQKAKDAWRQFLSEKGDEEGIPFASNGWGRRAAKALKGKRRARVKRTSRR